MEVKSQHIRAPCEEYKTELGLAVEFSLYVIHKCYWMQVQQKRQWKCNNSSNTVFTSATAPSNSYIEFSMLKLQFNPLPHNPCWSFLQLKFQCNHTLVLHVDFLEIHHSIPFNKLNRVNSQSFEQSEQSTNLTVIIIRRGSLLFFAPV
jgi:hypothetical protein